MPYRESLDSHQKFGYIVVAVIGITALVFAIFQIHRAVFEPLAIKNKQHFKTAEEIKQEQLDFLKKQDTDSDGLNDYDELYLFRTSPFLADSDSDGINDGDEVAQSTDPNCPKGSTCRVAGTEQPTNGEDNTSASSAPAPSADQAVMSQAMQEMFGDVSNLTPEIMHDRLSKLGSDELRSFLKKMGVPDDLLQKSDDQTLRRILDESLTAPPSGAITPDLSSGSGTGAVNIEQTPAAATPQQ